MANFLHHSGTWLLFLVDAMEISPKHYSWMLLRFVFIFILLIACWTLIASFYAQAKMHLLQMTLSWFNPSNTPFIRNPGFLQGYAISEITLISLSLARWHKSNIHLWKKYPWILLGCMVLILVFFDFLSNFLELISQSSSSFILNYTVTWLLSAGSITLPFLMWLWLESKTKAL
jgi:hypothetical protein